MIPTTGLLRVQPVAPEQPKPSDIVGKFFGALVGLALGAWFLMLGMGTAHTLWPAVPSVGYWQAVTLILGAQTVALSLRRPPWKWARL